MTTSRLRAVAAGFTLLEVLIAIVVVAFGLLGLAGLQVFSLRNNVSAAQRVAASALTSDIVDRMKANYEGVVAGRYNVPGSGYGPAVSTCADKGGACSFTDLANTDLFEWQARVAATLPGGVGRVCVDTTPKVPDPDVGTPGGIPTPDANHGCNGTGVNSYVVKIWWYDERGQGAGTGTQKYVYTTFNP